MSSGVSLGSLGLVSWVMSLGMKMGKSADGVLGDLGEPLCGCL